MCLSSGASPNLFDPEVKATDEVTILVVILFAVISPLTVNPANVGESDVPIGKSTVTSPNPFLDAVNTPLLALRESPVR